MKRFVTIITALLIVEMAAAGVVATFDSGQFRFTTAEDNTARVDGPAISYVSTRNYEPGELGNWSFTEVVFRSATLVAPLGTEEKYAAANGWKKFAHLKSSTLISGDAVFDTTDINEDGNIDGSDISILLEKVLAGDN